MYKLKFDLIRSFVSGGCVLDVGCSGGQFLDYFKKSGYDCYGIEYGKEAAQEAAKKHKVYEGDFLYYSQNIKFDLIIFRGVIEHIPNPRLYLNKAIQLLSDQAHIYQHSECRIILLQNVQRTMEST